MANQQQTINRRTCPHCLGSMLMDIDWMPPNGIDPRMTKFTCEQCNDDYYYTPKRIAFPTSTLYDKISSVGH